MDFMIGTIGLICVIYSVMLLTWRANRCWHQCGGQWGWVWYQYHVRHVKGETVVNFHSIREHSFRMKSTYVYHNNYCCEN